MKNYFKKAGWYAPNTEKIDVPSTYTTKVKFAGAPSIMTGGRNLSGGSKRAQASAEVNAQAPNTKLKKSRKKRESKFLAF